MVTGVETAGLVLAAFPILMQCLNVYVSSAQKVREMRRYRRVLRQFRRAIDMENCKFENTWYALVELAGENPSTIGELPWGAGVKARLLAQLRPASVRNFAEACEELNEILEQLNSQFTAYRQDRVRFRPLKRQSDTYQHIRVGLAPIKRAIANP